MKKVFKILLLLIGVHKNLMSFCPQYLSPKDMVKELSGRVEKIQGVSCSARELDFRSINDYMWINPDEGISLYEEKKISNQGNDYYCIYAWFEPCNHPERTRCPERHLIKNIIQLYCVNH